MYQQWSAHITRRAFLRKSIQLGVGVTSASAVFNLFTAAAGGEKLAGPVNWLSWPTYVVPEVVQSFRDKYGAEVNPIAFKDNSEAFTKLKLGGGSQYDIVQADAFWPVKYYEDGLIEPIDLNQMESAATLFSEFRDLPGWQTKQGIMMYANAWSPYCLMWNKKEISGKLDSWEVLWDKKFKGKVCFWGTAVESIALAGLILKYKPFAMAKKQIQEARDLLIQLKPNILTFVESSAEMVRLFVEGSIWVAYSPGPANVLRTKDAGGPPLDWSVPKEGTIGWIDGDMLVKGAAHREAALRYIDHRNSPENMFKLISKVKYPPANKKTVELLKAQGFGELVALMGMEHPENALKMELVRVPDNLDDYTEAWNEVLSS
jgi:spermidine/putrescine transport system substrate-binding protein